MPELPEVETMVRGIRDAFKGARIMDVVLPECERRPILIEPTFSVLRKESQGRRVIDVVRRAKRVVIQLDNDSAFVIEPRMTGLMLVSDPPTREHLRFEWQLAHGSKRRSVWFWDRRGLGTIRLLTSSQIAERLGESRLGPDALELTPATLKERLSRTSRPVKVALLDQKLIAGIGNLYASEILHLSGIHPETPSDRIRQPRLNRLLEAILSVLNEAIRYEGSTLGDGTYRNALNQDGGYQNQHRVYAREGEACPTCAQGKIERIVQAQRSTFLCLRCQK